MNHKQQTFITEYLRHRSPFTAYCLAYNLKDCSNYDSIMSSANRLLNHPEVSSVIDSVLDGIRQEVEQELRAEMKTEMLTIQRKRELLAKIATGETYVVQNYKGKDCNMCVQHVWPTINQMLKAIDLDNKMVGLYTAYNRQSTSQQLTVEQLPKSQQIPTNSEYKSGSQRENITNENPSFAASEIVVSPPPPEKSIEMATNHNNIEVAQPKSWESYNSDNIDSDRKNDEKATIPNKTEPLRIE